MTQASTRSLVAHKRPEAETSDREKKDDPRVERDGESSPATLLEQMQRDSQGEKSEHLFSRAGATGALSEHLAGIEPGLETSSSSERAPKPVPPIVYHGTPLTNLKGIQELGLIPAARPGLTASAAGARPPSALDAKCVFLYPGADSSCDVADRLRQTAVLLRVNTGKLDRQLARMDDHELQYAGPIPQDAIDVQMPDDKWLPLTEIEFEERRYQGVPVPIYILKSEVQKTEPGARRHTKEDWD